MWHQCCPARFGEERMDVGLQVGGVLSSEMLVVESGTLSGSPSLMGNYPRAQGVFTLYLAILSTWETSQGACGFAG